MSDKEKLPDSQKSKEHSGDTRKIREWADLSTFAGAVTGIISIVVSILDFLGIAQNIPPAIVATISGIVSIGIVLYTIWFLYQRQQKQKKEIVSALMVQEQKFLTQINQGFSKLLEEKAE